MVRLNVVNLASGVTSTVDLLLVALNVCGLHDLCNDVVANLLEVVDIHACFDIFDKFVYMQ